MNNRIAMLAIDAHRIAVDHGFWHRDHCSSPVATKVALIHTEIAEWTENPQDLEELADVVIRAADLAAALDVPQPLYHQVDAKIGFEWALDLHRIAAGITQSDRLGHTVARNEAIVRLIASCLEIAELRHVNLWDRINTKMEKNRRRPRLHGRAY